VFAAPKTEDAILISRRKTCQGVFVPASLQIPHLPGLQVTPD